MESFLVGCRRIGFSYLRFGLGFSVFVGCGHSEEVFVLSFEAMTATYLEGFSLFFELSYKISA